MDKKEIQTDIADAKEKSKDLLSKLGINVNDGEITINTNHTKDFFKSIKTTLDTAVQNAGESLKNLKTEESENLHKIIKVDNDVITIDTAKIQDFIKGISKNAEGLITSVDNSIKDILPSGNKKS